MSLVVIFCSTTSFDLQNIGYTLILVQLIFAYIARARFPRNESFEENHMTYIIRSIWIYSSIAAIAMTIMAIILVQRGNMDSIYQLGDVYLNGGEPSEDQMRAAFDNYIADNKNLILEQYLIWLFPVQLYLVWRIFHGGGRAFKSYRVANPKRWI
ncbi:MAG: hypothetical protein DI586_01825 [Micavibrio aeruginosavorus]|uniref:Uncharacterized protein n=1 Tax=Micavibrio aeruginosavorus TaxID=349221 RepID=A0A2W5HMW0_9BACT|nr:MAG: hypothetical protein DI586_01825 [Micavibrio aeruginosavorus]